jgi:hypothetical protein
MISFLRAAWRKAALPLSLATDSYPHEHANTAVGATFVGRRVKHHPSSRRHADADLLEVIIVGGDKR